MSILVSDVIPSSITHSCSHTTQDKYRLQCGQYSGKAGDALSGGSGMVQQWSAALCGMQFSTKDQVTWPVNWRCFLLLMLPQETVVIQTTMVNRTMTAISRAAVPRRMKLDGGSTGESLKLHLLDTRRHVDVVS